MRGQLPEPPEGHFWRVRESGLFGIGITTELRKRARFGSRRVYCREYLKGETAAETRQIPISSACQILQQMEADREAERIAGDYPPKVWK